MTLHEFNINILKEIENNPNLKDKIIDLYDLAMAEIEEGASATHEMKLCINSIEELKNDSRR